jgi:hypothetical protein
MGGSQSVSGAVLSHPLSASCFLASIGLSLLLLLVYLASDLMTYVSTELRTFQADEPSLPPP